MATNFASQSAVQIAAKLYPGAGAAEAYRVQSNWTLVHEKIAQAQAVLTQALGNAKEGWEGEAADVAIERISPFGPWVAESGAHITGAGTGAGAYGSDYSTARNTCPSPEEAAAAAAAAAAWKSPISTAGMPLGASLVAAEHADMVVAAQNAQAQAAMATYQSQVDTNTKPQEFPLSPQLTARTGGGQGGGGGSSATYDGLGGAAVTGYASTTSQSATRSTFQDSGPRGGQNQPVVDQVRGPQPGTTPGATPVAGAPTGSTGYTPVTGGSVTPGGAGTTAAGAGGRGAHSATPVTGGAAAGTGAGAGSAGRRGGAGPGSLGAAGTAGAAGLAGSGAGRGGAGSAGAGRGGAGSAGRGGVGSSGRGGFGETTGRGGVAGEGGRSGLGGSGGLNGTGPAGEGVGARGGAGAAGRGGAGMGGGGGAGRRGGQDDDEHETPDYLKDFEHFADGRVVAPPVIGADPQY